MTPCIGLPGIHRLTIFVCLCNRLRKVNAIAVQWRAPVRSRILPSGARACQCQLEIIPSDVQTVLRAGAMKEKPLIASLHRRSSFEERLHGPDVPDWSKSEPFGTLALLADCSPGDCIQAPEISVHVPHHRHHLVSLRHWAFVVKCTIERTRRTVKTVQTTASISSPIVCFFVRFVQQLLELCNTLRPQLDQALRFGASAVSRPVERSRDLRRYPASPSFRAPGMCRALVAALAESHSTASI
mmetsp:Transcript_132439/g.229167  ORF Transcript_132439/g.229167 Transcript_132439/m.229167 type:complete len:242 (-) Transcript_132439:14-739(-)